MKKLSIYLKTLLVAVGIGVGSNAWADNVASHNFDDQSTPFTIYDTNRIGASYVLQDGSADDYYVKYSCTNMNQVAFAYYNFSSSVSDAETVTVAFDFNVKKVSGHGLITIADADYHTGAKAGFSAKSNTGYGSNGAIFNLGCWRADDSENFAINSTKKTDLTATCLNAWCHANVVINNATRKVSYTISSLDGQTDYAAASNVDFMSANAQRCSQIDIYFGYYSDSDRNEASIDNLVITKTVSGTSHTYTIKAFDGETEVATIASGTATEGARYSANIPKCVTDATGKYYVLDDGSNQNLNNYFSFYTMGTANVDKTINYTLDESIAYYAESENMTGYRYSSAQTSNKLSKGSAYCAYLKNSTGYIKSNMGLTYPVIADIEAGIYGRKASTATLQLINGSDVTTDIGTQAVTEGGSATWSKEKQLIPVGSEFYMYGDNGENASKWALDYVIIRKAYYVGGATTSITDGAYVPFTLSTMTFTFSDAYTSEEASFAVLNSATAKLYNSSNEEIATGTLSVSGNVVTADFDNYALSAGSTYTITLPAGAVGYDGQISNSATSITVHTCAVTDGTYYLKNKATGAYFAAGLSWGTQAITNSIGHYVTVNSVLPAGTYTLNTHIYKSDSKHFLGSELFCDGASYEWTIEGDGEGYYTISDENSTITAGASGEALSLTSGTGDNTKWTLLTEAEWKAEQVARLDAATANNGVDATFYLPAANFNRCDDDENAKWQGSPAISGLGDITASTNFNAEKFTDPYATFDVYQALTGVKPGVYKLTAQGFYRNGLDNATDANDNLALLYANSTTVPLVNIRSTGYTDNSHSEEGFSTDKSGYYVPDNQGDASKAFNAGYYQNELNAFVNEDGALRIGVKKEAATGADKDWACFDNFQLTYYGEAIVNVATAFTNGASMTAGQWYYYDINFADSYTLTSETALANIVYTTDGTQMLNAGATFESSTPALTVGRYYIKSSTTQTLTITRANSGTYYWDFTDTSIWETSDFTSEATYKSDGTSGTLGANGIYFNLSGKVTVSESDGISFNKNAEPESITDKIPTTNYIRVSVPAGYKAAVEYYGYNSTRSVYFNFGGTETQSGAVAYTRRYFDNSEGTVPVDLYIYGHALNGDGRAKIYNINMIDMSTPTHTWTATAKAIIDGVSTVIDSWTSSSGNYTTTIHEDEYYYVPAKRVIIHEGKYYELNDAVYGENLLYKNWKMGNKNVNYDITYTEASDIVYYTELEDAYNSQITNSNKASGGQYVNFMNKVTRSAGTFTIGSYTVEANMLNRSPGNSTNFYLYPTSSASSALASFSGSTEGIQTYDFDLASSTELVFGADGSNNSAACDYILIRKTAERATLGTNGYGTFASPYPLDLANLPGGLTAYKASTISGKTVTFTAVTEAVQANTGLLLKGDAGESETIVSIPVAASGANISASNQFLVNTAGTTFDGDDKYYYFGLKKNTLTFGLFDPSTVAIPANKAYLQVLKSSVNSSVGDSRSLSIVFDDEATGVGASLMNNEERTMNNEVYDLQGRRVDGSRLTVNGSRLNPGIYIKNGRKVVVK